MARDKAAFGDILEIETPAGLAYLQYTHELEGMGSLVRVLPGLHSTRPSDFAGLARQKELYFTFYTLKYAIHDGDARIVSRQPIPDWAKPYPMMRHSVDSDRTGKTLLWRIVRADTPFTLEELKRAPAYKELTPELERLSIHWLLPHDSLVYDLSRGWTPERAEELRLKAVAEKKAREAQNPPPTPAAKVPANQGMRHYLYFSKKANAETAAARLRDVGFQVEVRKGADGVNWLALAIHTPPTDEDSMQRVCDEMESLAAGLRGEYDGHEIGIDASDKDGGQVT